MKTICLDVRMIRHTGIGTYIRGLLSGLKDLDFPADTEFRLAGDRYTTGRQPWPSENFPPPIYSLSEQFGYLTRLYGKELWHSPHYNVPFFKGDTKLVVTVHDLIHWIYRKDFFTPLKAAYSKLLFARTAAAADHIIAVSQHTKNDLVRYFKADPAKITVIYEAVGPEFKPQSDPTVWLKAQGTHHIPDSFFLYIGSLKPHKNVLGLVRAFRDLKKAGKIQSSLVVAGRKDKKYRAEYKELAELKSGNGIIYLPEIDQETLFELYRHARALVHPSFYEGFGLTILEAMASGAPVICSNAASLPEVAGNAAILVNPSNEMEIKEAMMKIEKDRELRESLRQKGFEQVKRFSWKETARQTLDVYRKVLGV